MKRGLETKDDGTHTKKRRKLQKGVEYVKTEDDDYLEYHIFCVNLIKEKEVKILVFDYHFEDPKLKVEPINLFLICEARCKVTHQKKLRDPQLKISLPVKTGKKEIDKLIPSEIFENEFFVFEVKSGLTEFSKSDIRRKKFEKVETLEEPTKNKDGIKLFKMKLNLTDHLNDGAGLWAAYLKD